MDQDYNLVLEMHSLLKAIKDKYRLFIITKVDSEDPESTVHKKAKGELQKLIDEGIILEHRMMYCTTQAGQIA